MLTLPLSFSGCGNHRPKNPSDDKTTLTLLNFICLFQTRIQFPAMILGLGRYTSSQHSCLTMPSSIICMVSWCKLINCFYLPLSTHVCPISQPNITVRKSSLDRNCAFLSICFTNKYMNLLRFCFQKQCYVVLNQIYI